MKKTHVAVFAMVSILCMAIAGTWFFSARGHRGEHPIRDTGVLRSPMAPSSEELSQKINPPSLPPARNPSGGPAVQRAFQTIDDVNRVNEMNNRK